MKPNLLLLAFVSAMLLSPALTHGQQGDVPSKKNIVILLADDLGWGDVGFHGGSADTPNIDKLANQGVRLNRFYAYPACSPARAALLTGRFPQRYGITGPVRRRDEGLPMDEQLLPAAFQKSGYQTSLIGKWHLGHSNDAKASPSQRGFDQFYGFLDASIDYFKHTGARGQVDWQRDGKTLDEQGYSTDLMTGEAVRQIKQRDKSRPFCMVLSFNAPHSPFQAPEKLVAKYQGRLNGRQATYAAMIDSMDQGIGRVLDTISSEDIDDDTIVVFASDNGAARLGTNAPLRGQKREVYEGGIHVPCVIRAPGALKPGTQSEQLFAIHDLFPTLAAASGVAIESSKPLDGENLWANLVDGNSSKRAIVIAENDFAIIGDQWKLIQFGDGHSELFNLNSDPHEKTNLAETQRTVAAQLLAQLTQYQTRVKNDQPAEMNVGAVAESQQTDRTKQEGELLAEAALRGDAVYGVLGDAKVESNGRGVRLLSNDDQNEDGQFSGELSVVNSDVTPDQRWYRFYISGLAQDNFAVQRDELYLKVEFFQKRGSDSLDLIKERIYPQVLRERKDFFDKSTNESLGHSTWRTYAMDFRTPFAEIDTLKLSVGFSNGKANDNRKAAAGKRNEFWVSRINLEPIDVPASYVSNQPILREFPQPDPAKLVALGGRWYFNPKDGNRKLPAQFDHTNAEQLLYKNDRFEAPFANNMSSWLRSGYLDIDGNKVEKDQYKRDAVTITFTDKHLVMKSRNLPNHPTATFPDRWRMLDGNPSYIKEQSNTWHIPLEPKRNPDAFAMDEKNANQALPMGPIGVATNGVIFFNPFDHIFETDAVWRLDRCCGHPSPQQQYHYHKYPVCVKTPWSDEGQSHSNVIGFAFDGFPVYGPYEAKGLLAKDDQQNPLNKFNLHQDDQRGPHYHVTPGVFPHIIGGYWGAMESLNRPARRGRRR